MLGIATGLASPATKLSIVSPMPAAGLSWLPRAGRFKTPLELKENTIQICVSCWRSS
jgi:hypothetical protein